MSEPAEPLVLDVRQDLRGGGRPMRRILQVVGSLAPGQDLLLRTTFEPVPLYAVLALRGFRHQARRLEGGDWEIRFSRTGARGARAGRGGRADRAAGAEQRGLPPTAAPRALDRGEAAQVPPETAERPWTRLDNRGLEPPEPMMRTLQTLNLLPAGRVLEIHNDRRPMFLYPHLRERGYAHRTVDAPDGSAFVCIWKVAAAGGEAEAGGDGGQ